MIFSITENFECFHSDYINGGSPTRHLNISHINLLNVQDEIIMAGGKLAPKSLTSVANKKPDFFIDNCKKGPFA